MPTFDRFDGADFVARRENDPVAHLDRAAFDTASKNPPVIESINILNRQTQRLIFWRLGDFKFIEHLEDCGTTPPGSVRTKGSDVVTMFSGDGHKNRRFDA